MEAKSSIYDVSWSYLANFSWCILPWIAVCFCAHSPETISTIRRFFYSKKFKLHFPHPLQRSNQTPPPSVNGSNMSTVRGHTAANPIVVPKVPKATLRVTDEGPGGCTALSPCLSGGDGANVHVIVNVLPSPQNDQQSRMLTCLVWEINVRPNNWGRSHTTL